MIRSWSARRLALACFGVAACFCASFASAEPGDRVGLLTSRHYVEGIPAAEASGLDDAAGAELARLLADPEASEAHANAVAALGQCGCGPAFEALRDFAARPREGALSRADYRAWASVPVAMAHLSDRDERALRWLADEAGRARVVLPFTHRHHSSARLARLRRTAVIDALGLVGTPAADAHLASLQLQLRGLDPAFSERVGLARERCARVGQHGRSVLRGAQP